MIEYLIWWGIAAIIMAEFMFFEGKRRQQPLTTGGYLVLLFLWPVVILLGIIFYTRDKLK